jgi:MerR family mercuric resistance operon transcriptional regulator
MTQNLGKPMSIGKLAKACDVGVETIRFYQRKGLLETPSGGDAGYRSYDERHAERLRFIRRAQGVGFTLEETRDLLGLNDAQDHLVAQGVAQEKIVQIEQRIAELQAMASALRHLVHQCQKGPVGTPCPIIRLALNGTDENSCHT